MKKQSIINLIKYHMDNNEDGFRTEALVIADEFSKNNDEDLANYIMELLSNSNYLVPQTNYINYKLLKKVNIKNNTLLLPDIIKEDVLGVVRAIDKHIGINKILFYGNPGTGKTESVYQVARLLDCDLLTVNFEELIDSRLGETAKNIIMLFKEINRLQSSRVIIMFDEIDAIVLNRINNNDLREMGRVTSTFLKELDALNPDITIIATTNLFSSFDKALLRRFDALVSFDRYTKEDLIEIADNILTTYLKKNVTSKKDKRLFYKILSLQDVLSYPGDLKQIIKTAIAFADEDNEFDYLRKIYFAFKKDNKTPTIQQLQEEGFTTREIEILTRIPKSSVARKLREEAYE